MPGFPDELSVYRLPFNFLYPRNWTAPGFEGALAHLMGHPELRRDSACLSDRSGKTVWRIDLPRELGGQSVVLKHCSRGRPWRYLLNLSLPARELRNYQVLYRLGIPAARVLAIGENRRLGYLRDAFIVTEFIPDTRNGCCFMKGGRERDSLGLRREFLRQTLAHLAALHRHQFFHKAIHLRNILWRTDSGGGMEVFFIDVARGRILPRCLMRRAVVYDLSTILEDLTPTPEEGIRILECYAEQDPGYGIDLDYLVGRMRAFRRHLLGRPCNLLDDRAR